VSVANIGDMPDTSEVTDRDLLIHLVSRVEQLWSEFEQFRPLLNMIKGGGGKPDMVGVLQARRELRKASRGT
jgi:hypothetical protein